MPPLEYKEKLAAQPSTRRGIEEIKSSWIIGSVSLVNDFSMILEPSTTNSQFAVLQFAILSV